jgi:hypothetical protein
MAERELLALEAVERAAVDVTNDLAIHVEEQHWTAKERALVRAIERFEDLVVRGRGREENGR